MAWQWKPAIFVHLIIFVVYFVFKSFNESWNPKCHGVKHHVQPNSLCSVIEYLSEVSLLRISFSSSSSSSSSPPPPPPPSSLGTLRSNDADDNKNVKKTIGLISKTTTLHVHHTFLYIFSRLYTTTTWKCLIARFVEDVNKQRRNFISVSELEYGPLKFRFRRVRLQLTK